MVRSEGARPVFSFGEVYEPESTDDVKSDPIEFLKSRVIKRPGCQYRWEDDPERVCKSPFLKEEDTFCKSHRDRMALVANGLKQDDKRIDRRFHQDVPTVKNILRMDRGEDPTEHQGRS